ncbi:hypothetical protein AQUSIP_08400 [Aquicella siphonis]|uniref:Integral membrane protein (PIN domain superfamily) n=1 Tax=Aquicella siphonis TaxID=254247 RepID=A0A5E4PEY8_9COXI|nr:hypothetical protein [Aquicella siphonis]VVC75550.1 hypothetical protein AQUSIP_08400 [Aquicella siphonis]
MNISRFLSKVLGIYLVIVSVALLVNLREFAGYVDALIRDAPLMFITGFFTLIIGIMMVVSHNIWKWDWRVIITILSWVILIKGASIILYPHFVDQLSILFVQNTLFAYAAGIVDFFLGLMLCYFGFRRS